MAYERVVKWKVWRWRCNFGKLLWKLAGDEAQPWGDKQGISSIVRRVFGSGSYKSPDKQKSQVQNKKKKKLTVI